MSHESRHLLPPSPMGVPASIPGSVEVPPEVAVLPLEGVVVFPLMIAPVVISEDRARDLVDAVMRGDRLVAVFHPLDESEADGRLRITKPGELYETGTLCSVLRTLKVPDGSQRLLLHGVSRIRIKRFVSREPFLKAEVVHVGEIESSRDDIEVEAMFKLTLDSLQRAIGMNAFNEELAVAAMNIEEPGKLADLVASNLPIRSRDLLPILGEADTKKRLRAIQSLLIREVRVLEIGNRINEEVRDEVDRNQRSFYLQQQMRAIRKELGEVDPHEAELDEMSSRIEKSKMPEHARKAALKELGRLQSLPTAAAEYGVIRTYLEWILDIPWGAASDDRIDIARARAILDEDHYGLEKVKERILEYLGVIRLKGGNLKGPILCFVGPPGVGKTSLGRSIARATGRKFQNFSLGGMRDEAEIRGHRRTYVGAMPGRIVKALKDSGTMNPLVMLDEIDKLGSDFRGDPASALLEVLDPEQNFHFNDHYMDMPIDLSKVMFITTANTLDSIPEPLRDRMEIIRIAGYTEMEKLEIAKRYLVPRELDNSGIGRRQLDIRKSALQAIIHDYTSEAGVRSLQREIGKVARKVAMKVAEHQSAAENANGNGKSRRQAPPPPPKAVVEKANIEDYLGPKKAFQEVAERGGKPGVAIGLAWTSVGGAILFVEASRYPASACSLKMTGQLGDVMKESGQAALSYIRAHREELGLSADDFAAFEYHVHVPAGATPKDGPSAGVAIATALTSLISGRPVRDFLAMTGEITLRGAVMPVGGIKEKCLAAHRAGVKEVLLPSHNEADYSEVPELVRKALKVRFFGNVGEYLGKALK